MTPDPYSTHLEALVQSACSTKGDILELGCGFYSTPVLSAIARTMGKSLVIMARDPKWHSQFRNYGIVIPESWDDPDFTGSWGTVLLDNEQLTRDRLEHIPALCKVAEQIVVHDADRMSRLERWKQYTAGMRQQWFKKQKPWTVILYCREPKTRKRRGISG
jgi:hypothetical protein